MAVHGSILYQRICRYSGCRAEFWICPQCDRGHCYCSPDCRRQARLQQRRCANRRYQQSVEARLDHCDRQHAYRCRRKSHCRVTGHTSLAAASPALCSYASSTVALATHNAASGSSVPARRQPCCIVCGCVGRAIVVPVRVWRR
jgi:hypothetical protein